MSDLQRQLMVIISDWVKQKKEPVPRDEIIEKMSTIGVNNFTTINTIKALVSKGYIRKAITRTKKACYVQIRTL